MQRCRTCKAWELISDGDEEHGQCWEVNSSKSAFILTPADAVIATRDEPTTMLITGPEFGCVLHEPREDATP
jgi:hypothetical protein